MNYKLIKEPNADLSAVAQVLVNRGLPIDQLDSYINFTNFKLSKPELLGEDKLKKGLQVLVKTIQDNATALIIVDCDCDGYTSAALLINYLYKLFPSWVENKLSWWMHDSKTHGLVDCLEEAKKYQLVICPDSGSNDVFEHQELNKENIPVLVLDHHQVESGCEATPAIVINNQNSDYPNKELSGVGVVWQFCRYIDKQLGIANAGDFLDLVALGLDGDMESLLSIETRYLINMGFKKESIQNPFIEYILEKNEYPLSKSDYVSSDKEAACTPMGATFFIVPFINAITRSGTIDEKKIVFNSMLQHRAFTRVLSDKRGHKPNEEELLVIQAIRVTARVKSRQAKAEEAGMALLEAKIEEENLLDNKILLFLLENDDIDAAIKGLAANRLSNKYQRPCIVCAKHGDEYLGSMRGYTKKGISNFMEVLQSCRGVNWVRGHGNAAGVSLDANKIDIFLEDIENLLKNVSTEVCYLVDYEFKQNEIDTDKILEIADMNDYWGQDIERALVAIKFKVMNDNFFIMKSNTLKIDLQDVCLIKFDGSEEDIENFTTLGWKEIVAICKCNCNRWNGNCYPQLMIQDYEIIDSCKYFF